MRAVRRRNATAPLLLPLLLGGHAIKRDKCPTLLENVIQEKLNTF
jgi:hypothetical protein